MPAQLRLGWRIALFLAIVIGLTYAGNLARPHLFPGVGEIAAFVLRALQDFLVFLFATWLIARIEGRTIGFYGLPRREMFRSQFWIGSLIGFAAITSLMLLLGGAGTERVQSVGLHGVEIVRWAVLYLVFFVFVGVREEFQYRGYLLIALGEGIGFWPAAAITSALFGAGHLGNHGENLLGAFNAALFGVVMCFVIRRKGHLWMPIGIHMAFDWGETYFYGVADSGHVTPGHLLNTTSSADPVWLSGGTVGPEGSVLCTLVLLMMWALFAWRLRPIQQQSPSAPLPLPSQSV